MYSRTGYLVRAVSHRPENETWKKKPWFYFPGFCLFFVSHRNRENIFLVFTFQLIFLYHTDPFLQTGEIFLRFWPKMEFENAIFSISASTNFGLLFHIWLLKDSMPTSFLRYHEDKMAIDKVSSQLDIIRKPAVPRFPRNLKLCFSVLGRLAAVVRRSSIAYSAAEPWSKS